MGRYKFTKFVAKLTVYAGFYLFVCLPYANAQECQNLFKDGIFITSLKEKIAYSISGKRDYDTAVIFLNGIDKSSKEWNPLLGELLSRKPNLTYIRVDLLGQGQTAKLNKNQKLEIPYFDQIRILGEFIKENKLVGKKLILVGHSYGGGIAARFMRDNPGIIEDVVLIAPFVDYLEVYQKGVGPLFALSKAYSDFWGLRPFYESNLMFMSEIAMRSSWDRYVATGMADGELSDVVALTRGNRNLGMLDSVKRAGDTRIHLLISSDDKLIPNIAHEDLWKQVPAENRGKFVRLETGHESVILVPKIIAEFLLKEVLK